MAVTDKDKQRITNSTRNATVALLTSLLMGVLSFFERTQFNHCYMDDYLGMFSFFNNIINILSCSELGITTAIGYALYRPIAENNQEQIKAIIGFMKKIYFFIGLFILVGGFVLIPTLPFLLKTDIPYKMVSIYFILFVSKTVFTYWLTASSIILSATQQQYKITFTQNMSWCIQYILLMIVTAVTSNFLLYSIVLFLCSFFCAVSLNHQSRKQYPFLKEKTNSKLSKGNKKIIVDNTKGLINTKIGSIIVSSTDSILISAMVSVSFLGKYANYQMIIAGISGVIAILPNAISASIGDLGVTESKRKVAKSFETINLAHFFCYSIITTVLLCISNPIVETFFGANKTVPMLSLAIICANFYINSLRQMIGTYKSSLGLYYQDRKRPIFEAILNIIYSIILGYFWGFNGILLGTILTHITVNLWYEPLIIYHHGFNRSAFFYYLSLIGRALITALASLISIYATSKITINGLGGIIIKTLISFTISAIILFVAFRKNENAQAVMNTLKYMIREKIKMKTS